MVGRLISVVCPISGDIHLFLLLFFFTPFHEPDHHIRPLLLCLYALYPLLHKRFSTFFNPQVGTNIAGTPYKPVTGDQYEAGLKYQPPASNLSATFALFDLTQSNTLTADPTNPFNQLQIGETRSKGFETQVVANINRELSLVGSFTTFDSYR